MDKKIFIIIFGSIAVVAAVFVFTQIKEKPQAESQIGAEPASAIEQQTVTPVKLSPSPKAPKKAEIPKAPARFVLYNIGINFEDILFTKTIGDHYYNKAFLEFGAQLTGPNGTDFMPHPTYFLPIGTKVFSPVSGKIESVRSQPESSDYEIVIVPEGFSSWRVSFDHITNLSVRKGDVIKAGDIVAQVAASRSSAIPAELGWVELQVWKESSSLWQQEMLATCPFLLLDENIKNDIAEKITKLASDWEKFLGKDVYEQEKWVFPGCLLETTPA